MRHAIRKHMPDFVALIALFAVAAREGRAGNGPLLPAQGSPIP